MESDELIKMLCNRLLENTATNNRNLAANERLARAVEDVAHQLNTNVPAILSALGIIREETGKFAKEEEPTALRIWDRFAAAPARLQWIVVVLAIGLMLSGWAGHVIRWVSGGH